MAYLTFSCKKFIGFASLLNSRPRTVSFYFMSTSLFSYSYRLPTRNLGYELETVVMAAIIGH